MISKYLKTISELLLAMAEELKMSSGETPPDGKESTPPSGEKKEITLEKVREYLAQLTSNGHKDEVSALLKQYGTGKLSSVPAEKYAELYAAAQGVEKDA